MKTTILILSMFGGFSAYSQTQDTRVQDSRIYFQPEMPSPRVLIKRDMTFWPNPAVVSTRVVVKNMPDHIVGSGYSMRVYDKGGRLIQKQSWSAGEHLDVSKLQEGIYLVTLQKGDLLFTQKLSVKK